MSVDHFPGNFRVGALNEPMSGVRDPAPSLLKPKFLVMILLRGRQVFWLEGKRIELIAGTDPNPRPTGFAVILKEPSQLKFEGSWGDPFQKISIAGPPDWFQQIVHANDMSETFPNFPDTHGEHRIWSPGPDLLRLANQIVFAPPEESQQQLGLFRMSRALEILRRIPHELAQQGAMHVPAPAPSSNLKSIEELRIYVVKHLEQDLSLAQLEVRFGLNRRSIQRKFKQEYGIGLSEFIRLERLSLANRALQKDGITISQAAHIAGYNSSANFSTAFKREYGVSPNGVRNRTV